MLEFERFSVTILVVEDEHSLREAVAGFLQDAGCTVIEAATGERAIAICNSDIPIDIVLTDIQLPGGTNGFDVAEAFRAAHVDMPIIYVSGNSDVRERCVAGSLFFQKPYRMAEILAACLQFRKSQRVATAPRRAALPLKRPLSSKEARKAAMRAAKLKSSSWYDDATRSISIKKGKTS